MRIGIDLGGTKIAGIVLDRSGAAIAERRTLTPKGDYGGTVRAVRDLVAALESACGSSGTVGVGIPGTIDRRTGLVKNANSTWLIGKPFDRDLAAALGRDVRLENDANCFALSEASDGAGAGAHVVFGVILGTGCGGGVVVGGTVLKGAHGIAGEWGHNPLPTPGADEVPGPACYCGQTGCIETFLSGPGLSADHARATGARLPAEAIVAAMRAGEATAAASLARYRDRLARALAGIVNVLDPDVIVLGGGLSNVDEVYDGLGVRIAARAFTPGGEIAVRRARFGDASGVRGAAWLWPPT